MVRRITGAIMVLVGGFFTVVLLTGGGPVLPHVIGPITLAVVGAVLLAFTRKTK